MDENPIESLIHLHVDGAFGRRELIQRLVKYTGSVAAATAAVESAGLLQAQTQACPAGVQVPADAPDLTSGMVSLWGAGGPLFAYLSMPKQAQFPRPSIVVIHENRGLTDHIKDVTRRVARAGYVALGIDLLSRQGGSDRFTDPTDQVAAYGRTVPAERREDLITAVLTLKNQPYSQPKIGAVGFCAGGMNTLDLAASSPDLNAAVAFYGPVPAATEPFEAMNAALMVVNGELDRNVNAGLARLLAALHQYNKRYAVHLYPGVRHAFHNDTGASYDAAAACDAWQKTLEFFKRHLDS